MEGKISQEEGKVRLVTELTDKTLLPQVRFWQKWNRCSVRINCLGYFRTIFIITYYISSLKRKQEKYRATIHACLST